MDIKIRELMTMIGNREVGLLAPMEGAAWSERKAPLLADSLYRGFSIGGLRLWERPNSVIGCDHSGPTFGTEWRLLDGQRRVTALCALFGQQPHWVRQPLTKKIQFNPRTEEFRSAPIAHPAVATATAHRRGRGRPPAWVDVAEVLRTPNDAVLDVLCTNLGEAPIPERGVYSRLETLRRLRDSSLPAAAITMSSDDLNEHFRRLALTAGARRRPMPA